MIRGLNGVRAIAFLLVFLLHTGYLQFGWVGVQLFFVLSGFLITDILMRMKSVLGLKAYLYTFYTRRALRIFPLYFFFITLILLISMYLIGIGYKSFLLGKVLYEAPFAFAFVFNFFASLRDIVPSPLFMHLWSLSIEEQFYLFWPLVIFIVPQKYSKHLFITGIVSGVTFRLLFHVAHTAGLLDFMTQPSALAMYTLPFSHIDAFAFGAFVSRFEIRNAVTKLFWTGGILSIAGYLSLFASVGSVGEWSALGYPVTLPSAYQFIWAYSALNYFFALFVYCVAKNGLWVRAFDTPVLDYLGRISYGLYIYHVPVIWFSTRLRDVKGFEGVTPLQISVVAFAATLLISTLSFYVLENPLIRLKERYAHYQAVP